MSVPAPSILTLPRRTAVRLRETRETRIRIELDLDPAVPSVEISTGIGFFDHMLEALARHSGIALTVEAEGDLHVDAHHTMEDVGLTLGDCLAEALGESEGGTPVRDGARSARRGALARGGGSVRAAISGVAGCFPGRTRG